MQKRLSILLTLFLIFASFPAVSEEISPIPVITGYENALQERMYAFHCMQREELAASIELNGESYWNEWFPDMPLSHLLPLLQDGNEKSTIFFSCPNTSRLLQREKLSIDKAGILRGRILSASLYSACTLNAFTAAVIDGLSVYSTWEEAAFHGAAYVVSFYGDEFPCVITAFVEDGNGRAMTKTSLIYTEGATDGSEFLPIAGYIVSQWGWDGETFDIRILNRTEDDTVR